MHTEAIELGLSLRVLASAPDSSAAQVAHDVVLGDYRERADLSAVAAGADAVTFDHEHVPNELLDELISQGINVQPQPSALIYAQDKLHMRTKLQEIGAPVPPFSAITSVEDARAFSESVGGKVCLKSRRGGYDGKGVWFPKNDEELNSLVTELLDASVDLMAEKLIPFERELSAMVARTPSGQTQPWPVVQSRQSGGICVEAVAPAPDMSDELRQRCEELSARVATELGVTGVLAVELFEYRDEDGQPAISVNELAMRPHNTGHWTQDGCVTSQFEQHLRAVLDLPLGDTRTVAPVTVMANVLGGEEDGTPYERVAELMRRFPEAKVHLYGKDVRPGRKIGHVNIVGASEDSVAEVRERAQQAARFLATGSF
ncbi:5-(carboxyamino)imidazole ribonucleotide synthase [Corynebacterium tapiri]